MSDTRLSPDADVSQSSSALWEPPPLYERRDLPAGWIKEHDSQSDRDYFVDTLANPPRSIWVHPLDDPEFMLTHRGDDGSNVEDLENNHLEHPPPGFSDKVQSSEYPEDKQARHDDENELAQASSEPLTSTLAPPTKKQGLLSKLKQKAIGTKEEREAARQMHERRRKEQERQYYERRNAMVAARMQQIEAQEQRRRQQAGHSAQRGQQYDRPAMNAYGGPMYEDPYANGSTPYGRRQGGGGGLGGGGTTLGTLSGGLLLGDLVGGY
ncbi:hypothetical protein DL93DRAFT_2170858 [Clavulina sp. PMI_390]|nr:hypothetical protein DL93DRAFT_2170858 [Clavulina sp. PMI_390]